MTWPWVLVLVALAVGLFIVGAVMLDSRSKAPESDAEKQLVEIDRAQLSRLLVLMEALAMAVDEGGATGLRLEKAATAVANELAASQGRADIITDDPGRKSGDAADAAAGSAPDE